MLHLCVEGVTWPVWGECPLCAWRLLEGWRGLLVGGGSEAGPPYPSPAPVPTSHCYTHHSGPPSAHIRHLFFQMTGCIHIYLDMYVCNLCYIYKKSKSSFFSSQVCSLSKLVNMTPPVGTLCIVGRRAEDCAPCLASHDTSPIST